MKWRNVKFKAREFIKFCDLTKSSYFRYIKLKFTDLTTFLNRC